MSLKTHDNAVIKLHGTADNIKLGRLIIDVDSMIAVGSNLIYYGRPVRNRQNRDMDGYKSIFESGKGTVQKYARRIELARLMTHR